MSAETIISRPRVTQATVSCSANAAAAREPAEQPGAPLDIGDLRVALFSGNYNYTRDGANVSLNRLVGFLLAQGAAVRIYSPVVDKPAFAAIGDVVGVPAVPIPGRSEYRLPCWIGRRIADDLERFSPNIIHISAPEILAHWAVSYARKHDLPVLASVHTRFDTYLRYYRLGFVEPLITAILRRLYRRCDAIVAPTESMADVLRQQRVRDDIGTWPSGVDSDIFSPTRRSLAWRRSLGFADDDVVIGFVGRLVAEKGIAVFAQTIHELERRGVPHRVLVVGDGPARAAFEKSLPKAVFAGFLGSADVGRAMASMDIFFNPSITETFGVVTLEAMACGTPVVGANAPGTASLVVDGHSGRLVTPGAIAELCDALEAYVVDAGTREAAGAAGAEIAGAYSWDAVNGLLAEDYLRLIARYGVRARPATGG